MAVTKPLEVLELSGAFKHDPQRRRKPSPKSLKAFGSCPSHLTDTEKDVWRELISNAPDHALTASDRACVEIVTRLLTKFRAGWLPAPELAQLTSNLARLGWTPADRSRVTSTAGHVKDTDEFDFLK